MFGFDNDPGELINVLHETQGTFGYLPASTGSDSSKSGSVVSACVRSGYLLFLFHNGSEGEFPISICMGTACYVRGARKKSLMNLKELNIKVGETTGDGKFSINCLRCVGACGLAPVVMIGEKSVRTHCTRWRESNFRGIQIEIYKKLLARLV